MTAWGWVGLALAWAISLLVAWIVAQYRGHVAGNKRATAREVAIRGEGWDAGKEAGFRAAATATRATIADELSKLEPMRCGGGHAGHVRRTDVQRIVVGEPTNG